MKKKGTITQITGKTKTMSKIKRIKKVSYSEHWLKQGTYGEIRIARMLRRKEQRHDKRSSRIKNGLKRGRDGKLYQICDYQPIGCMGTCWCEYPCNRDC